MVGPFVIEDKDFVKGDNLKNRALVGQTPHPVNTPGRVTSVTRKKYQVSLAK